METFSVLLTLCAGNSPVTGEFPSQSPLTRRFNVVFDQQLNKWLSERSKRWWFETPSRSLLHHCNAQTLILKVNDDKSTRIQTVTDRTAHGQYSHVAWASRHLKSQATRLFYTLFMITTKTISKIYITVHLREKCTSYRWISSQRNSNSENVSISWGNHEGKIWQNDILTWCSHDCNGTTRISH